MRDTRAWHTAVNDALPQAAAAAAAALSVLRGLYKWQRQRLPSIADQLFVLHAESVVTHPAA